MLLPAGKTEANKDKKAKALAVGLNAFSVVLSPVARVHRCCYAARPRERRAPAGRLEFGGSRRRNGERGQTVFAATQYRYFRRCRAQPTSTAAACHGLFERRHGSAALAMAKPGTCRITSLSLPRCGHEMLAMKRICHADNANRQIAAPSLFAPENLSTAVAAAAESSRITGFCYIAPVAWASHISKHTTRLNVTASPRMRPRKNGRSDRYRVRPPYRRISEAISQPKKTLLHIW